MAFEVSKPKPGYVYYWERDDHRMISYRRAQARFMLGPNAPGWEVVASSADPEAKELIMPDNTRKIGDVVLMRIRLESYVEIQKRIALMTRFKEANISEKLSDFVREHGGLVQVHTMVNESPREYFGKKGTTLVHTDAQENNFRPADVQPGTVYANEEQE
jgi:hypothetical protein